MGSFAKHVILTHAKLSSAPHLPPTTAVLPAARTGRRPAVVSTAALLVSAMLEARRPPLPSYAESWGTRSFMWEKYFSPGLSPEEAVARIRQTTEGMHDMRHMLETLSWHYVMFYIRLKSAYLDSDLKNAMATLPVNRRKAYAMVANEVVDNMTELDRYVRSPKVYESYVYYEKTLKSLDDLVALLA
uniref:Photosynthetic NDH subcomplex L 2 n=1 Tax=Goodyera fumata TaxID=1390594 RepID=A0A0F7GYN7_9ASPA